MIEIAPNVIRMQLPIWMPGLGHVNMYGLLDDRGLAVVDPGLPGPSVVEGGEAAAQDRRLTRSRTSTPSSSRTRIPTTSVAPAASARRPAPSSIAHRAFTTWSLSESSRRNHLPTEEEQLEAERIAAAAAQALDVSRRGDPHDRRPRRRLTRTTRCATTRRPSSTRVRCRGVARRRGAGRSTRCRSSRGAWRSSAMRMLFVPPDPSRRVRHAERVQLAGREWVSVHTPGHTIDHLCLYDPEYGLLLSGDHVLPSITPHISGVGNGADALQSYIQTLDLVAALDGVKLGLPAHGHPFDRCARPRRGDQGASRRAHGAASSTRRSRSGRPRCSSSRTRSSRASTGA